MKRAWNYLLAEPFMWIFYAFFQPRRFEREVEQKDRRQRFVLLLRVTVPMFLLAYPIGVIGRLFFIHFHLLSHADIVYILFDTAGVITFSIAIGIAVGIAFGIAIGIAVGIASDIMSDIVYSIAFAMAVGITLNIAVGIASDIIVSIVVSIAFIIAFIIVNGIAYGIMIGTAYGIVAGTVFIIMPYIGGLGPEGSIIVGFAIASFGIVSYLIGLFRLPFYLVSSSSMLRAYRACRNNPSQVFTYLQCSSLHWDEIVYLPLPYLKETLLLAYDQDFEKVLEEITFIATARPRQIWAARAALLEIAVQNLAGRKKMSEIAEAAQFLDRLFPQETKLLDPQWATPIMRLREASQDAARFGGPLGRRARLEAVQDMIKHVKGARLSFGDARLRSRFDSVVDVWLTMAQQEQEKLEQMPDYIGRIDNPYSPGGTLKPNDPLFRGRLDLAQMLEMELMKGERRPTFLMTGERRMGKSSALQQLPLLLGSHYVPIFYDLQSPGIFDSTPTFLGTLAEGITREMNTRKMSVRELDYRALRRSTPSQRVPTSQSFSESDTPQSSSESSMSQRRYEEGASAAYRVFYATLKDVTRAIDLAFNNWWDTYFRDLWIRTDEPQRACLIALRKLEVADRERIRQESGRDDILARRTLQALLKRDLVRQDEDGMYGISTPIFGEWVERSMYT